jgi:hypothetical protein
MAENIDCELNETRGAQDRLTAIRRNTSSLIGEVSKPPQVALTSNGKPEARFQELVKECGKLKKAALLREFIFAEKDALEAAKGGGDGTPTAKLSGVEMRKLLNRVAISGNAPQDVHQLIEACLECSRSMSRAHFG